MYHKRETDDVNKGYTLHPLWGKSSNYAV